MGLHQNNIFTKSLYSSENVCIVNRRVRLRTSVSQTISSKGRARVTLNANGLYVSYARLDITKLNAVLFGPISFNAIPNVGKEHI